MARIVSLRILVLSEGFYRSNIYLVSILQSVVVTGVSPGSLGAETVQVLAPYAKTIIVASRSIERFVLIVVQYFSIGR